jgi:hypothetical protein
MLLVQTYITGQELKREHPGLVREFNKKHKSGIVEKTLTWIKILITCFVPIVNIGIFWVSMFEAEEIKAKGLIKLLDQVEGEKNKI